MKVLTSFGSSFLCALAIVIALMLVFKAFDSHALKPLVAVGIATGIGLSNAVRVWKGLSLNTFALLVAVLASLGSAVGNWFSTG